MPRSSILADASSRGRLRPVVRRAILACVAALTLLSAGCLEVHEEIHVREDGSARYVLDVALLQDAVKLGDDRGAREGIRVRDLGTEFRDLAEMARRRSRDVGAVSGFDARESVDDCGYHHFRVQLDVDDAEKLGAAHQQVFADLDVGMGELRHRRERHRPDVEVEELSDENLGVLRSFDADGLLGLHDEPGRVLTQAFAASALAGRELVVVVDGPSIVSANGRIAEDRRSVEWHVPLGQLVTGAPPPQDLRAEVRIPRSHWPWIAIGLVVALLGGIGAIVWMRRQEPEVWRA